MTQEKSDALVFFGATGDLAYKKVFPALESMVKHGDLDMPVIGVAKAGWNWINCASVPSRAWPSTGASTSRHSPGSPPGSDTSTATITIRPRTAS